MKKAIPRQQFNARLFIALVAALSFGVVADSAFAQSGGMRRAGGGKKSDPKQPQKFDRPPPVTPGNMTGTIIKYKPAKESDAEKGIAGFLYIRPFEKGAKLLKLAVFKEVADGEGDAVLVRLGDHRFERNRGLFRDFLEGLCVNAGWGYKDEDAKVKVKELRTLDFNSLEVKGKIDSIEDDVITIRAVPKNDQDWPHLAAKDDGKNQNGRAGAMAKPKKIRNLKVKLKMVEDVSKLFDAENEEASISSFEAGQAIEATIIYSSKFGMIVKLAPPGVSGTESTPEPPPDDGGKGEGGRGGPPRAGGPRTGRRR
ncbi:MAG: hypothetical protein IPK83_16805 [Planctomycetes bacterium]|nr:hypothetical protein [Planctomycetota bacterium]